MSKIMGVAVLAMLLVSSAWAGTNQVKSATLSINVVAGLTIPSQTLPAGVSGVVYPNTQLQASGGTAPYSWVITTQTGQTGLPKGLVVSTAGVISGTIDPAACLTGTCAFSFTATVTDSSGLLGKVVIEGKYKNGGL